MTENNSTDHKFKDCDKDGASLNPLCPLCWQIMAHNFAEIKTTSTPTSNTEESHDRLTVANSALAAIAHIASDVIVPAEVRIQQVLDRIAALQQPAEYSIYCHFFHQTGICGTVEKKHDDLEIGHGFIRWPVTATPATEPVRCCPHAEKYHSISTTGLRLVVCSMCELGACHKFQPTSEPAT